MAKTKVIKETFDWLPWRDWENNLVVELRLAKKTATVRTPGDPFEPEILRAALMQTGLQERLYTHLTEKTHLRKDLWRGYNAFWSDPIFINVHGVPHDDGEYIFKMIVRHYNRALKRLVRMGMVRGCLSTGYREYFLYHLTGKPILLTKEHIESIDISKLKP